MDFNQTLAAFVLSPRKAAASVARRERLSEGLVVYAAAVAASILFYGNLPRELPAAFKQYFPFLAQDLPSPPGFWLKIALLGTVLFIVEVGALWGWIRGLRGRAGFLALLSLMCWIHIFYLAMFVMMQVGVWASNAELAYISELGFTLWSMVIATFGIRDAAGLTIGRAFAGLVLSSIAVAVLLLGLKAAGLVGADELKVLLLF